MLGQSERLTLVTFVDMGFLKRHFRRLFPIECEHTRLRRFDCSPIALGVEIIGIEP